MSEIMTDHDSEIISRFVDDSTEHNLTDNAFRNSPYVRRFIDIRNELSVPVAVGYRDGAIFEIPNSGIPSESPSSQSRCVHIVVGYEWTGPVTFHPRDLYIANMSIPGRPEARDIRSARMAACFRRASFGERRRQAVGHYKVTELQLYAGSVYVKDLDITLCLNGPEGLRQHPGINRHYECELPADVSKLQIQMVINDPLFQLTQRFVNILGHVVEVPIIRDGMAEPGVRLYATSAQYNQRLRTATNLYQGNLELLEIVPLEEADERLRLHATRESASGEPDAPTLRKHQMELERHAAERQSHQEKIKLIDREREAKEQEMERQREIHRLKYEETLNKIREAERVSEMKIADLERQFEEKQRELEIRRREMERDLELKHRDRAHVERMKENAMERDYFFDRVKMHSILEKDMLDRSSQRRRNWGEVIKSGPVVISGLASLVGLILAGIKMYMGDDDAVAA